MTSLDPAQPPLHLMLEFVRATEAGEPFAFRFATQEYLLRSEGGGFQSAVFPWDDALLADLRGLRRPGGDAAVRQRLGDRIRRFLFDGGWTEQEARIREALAANRSVILTIRSAAAELYALPWELLTLKASGQHLGELDRVLVRYEWPESTTTAALPSAPGQAGRILLAWSAAGGQVPAAAHLTAIRQAAQAGGIPFDEQRDVLAHASLGKLRMALDEATVAAPIAVLHLLCHGGETGGVFGLSLDSQESPSHTVIVDAAQLRQVLAPYAGMVRLIVLSACDGSNPGALGNQLGSVAQALHRSGFAAVVASRYPLSVSGSTQITQSLYERLAGSHGSLEDALRAARRRLHESPQYCDWASLQLYARAADGNDSHPLGRLPHTGQPSRTSAGTATAQAPRLRNWTLVGVGAIALTGIGTWLAMHTASLSLPTRPPDAAQSATGVTSRSLSRSAELPACGGLVLDDVVSEKEGLHVRLDVRLRSEAARDLNITRAAVVVVKQIPGRSAYVPSADYDLMIEGPRSEKAVAHLLHPGEVDSFVLRLGFSESYSAKLLEAQLVLRYNRDCTVTSDLIQISSELAKR